MVKNCFIYLFILLIITFNTNYAAAKDSPIKKGILLVAFGSSVKQTQGTFLNIEQKIKTIFPNIPVKWAFSSRVIRNKLLKEGTKLDSVESGLSKMTDEGFTHVAVQSLHTINGKEFSDLLKVIEAFESFSEGLKKINVGLPLISSDDDMKKLTLSILKNIPKERKRDEALLLMGHGTTYIYSAHAVYTALMYHLQQKDPNIFVATVEGYPSIQDIKNMLLEKKIKKVFLMPLMSVAGEHANNDLAGDKEDSWKSILKSVKIESVPILKGTAEYDNILEIWIDHLKTAFNELQK